MPPPDDMDFNDAEKQAFQQITWRKKDVEPAGVLVDVPRLQLATSTLEPDVYLDDEEEEVEDDYAWLDGLKQ
eukprot:3330703-Amphidinium_carterae.1